MPTYQFVDFKFSNDFVFGTDKYYSNGIELNLCGNFMKKSPVNQILLPNSLSDIVYFSVTFTHKIYTPTELFTSELQFNDQPYASYLLLGSRKESYNFEKRVKLISELQLGVIGPMAGGKQVQNTIHSLLPTSRPAEGWSNQIDNSFALQYNASVEKGLISKKVLEFNGIISGAVGAPHTEFDVGGYLRVGLFNNYFEGTRNSRTKKMQLYIFGSATYKFVAYNAVLEGGLFNQDAPNKLKRINHSLAEIISGIAFDFKTIKVEFEQHMLTPQFKGATKHSWGSVRFVVDF